MSLNTGLTTTTKKVTILASLTFAIFFIYGCGGPEISRGRLSETVKKSNDQFKGDRKIADTKVSEDTASCFLCPAFDNSSSLSDLQSDSLKPAPIVTNETKMPGAKEWNNDWNGEHYWGVRGFTSTRFSKNFKSTVGIGALSIYRGKHKAHELELQSEVFTTKTNSNLFGSINELVNFGIGYHRQRFFTPFHTIMGLCLKDGIDINAAFWSYKNPVYSNSYDEQKQFLSSDTIKFDGIFGINADIGIAWLLVQHEKIGLSLELLAGTNLFWIKTFSSLNNDMLSPEGYLKLSVEFLFRKKKYPQE